jgi:hypothetical protein
VTPISITRAEVLHRAVTIWPLGQVAYSQSAVRDPGWRTDCSGYVSMCLDLAPPGLSTVTLVTEGHLREITRDELRPGDLVGRCGPGTAGDAGHVVLFDRWEQRPELGQEQAHETYWAYELRGGPQPGPEHRLIHYPYRDLVGYQAYRYTRIAD